MPYVTICLEFELLTNALLTVPFYSARRQQYYWFTRSEYGAESSSTWIFLICLPFMVVQTGTLSAELD